MFIYAGNLVIDSEIEKFIRRMWGCATCIITVARYDRYQRAEYRHRGAAVLADSLTARDERRKLAALA